MKLSHIIKTLFHQHNITTNNTPKTITTHVVLPPGYDSYEQWQAEMGSSVDANKAITDTGFHCGFGPTFTT